MIILLMPYVLISPFWQAVYDWQTLIAGILALLAAFGTIWATIISANREISAAQNQMAVAQRQTRLTLALDRRRVARESFAFLSMMDAVMSNLIEDVAAACQLLPDNLSPDLYSHHAFDARHRLSKTGFADLLTATVSVASPLASEFLRLDRMIDDFASQILIEGTARDPQRLGSNAGAKEQLSNIETAAASLHRKAAEGMKRCQEVIKLTDVDLE